MSEQPRVSGQMTQDGGQQVGDTAQPARQAGGTAQPAQQASGTTQPAQQASGTAQPAQQASGTTQPAQLPQHVVKRTRIGGVWLASASFAVVLLLLLIFILENGRSVDVAYFGAHGHLPLGVALLLAAVLGILMVVIPGTARIVQLRMTARRHRRTDASRLGASQQQPSTAGETPAPGRR
jgi:uncharacterized integral membrane protein